MHRCQPVRFWILIDAILIAGCAVTAASIPISQPRTVTLNWAQDKLRDGAQDGCPGQYKTWTNVDHVPYLTGCWGEK